jgi:hypothetical protein
LARESRNPKAPLQPFAPAGTGNAPPITMAVRRLMFFEPVDILLLLWVGSFATKLPHSTKNRKKNLKFDEKTMMKKTSA